MSIGRLGTQVLLADGRVGTVVYNGLDGVGIKWGLHDPSPEDFQGTSGGLFSNEVPDGWPWEPDAMLRNHYPQAGIECVGEDYEITRIGLGE